MRISAHFYDGRSPLARVVFLTVLGQHVLVQENHRVLFNLALEGAVVDDLGRDQGWRLQIPGFNGFFITFDPAITTLGNEAVQVASQEPRVVVWTLGGVLLLVICLLGFQQSLPFLFSHLARNVDTSVEKLWSFSAVARFLEHRECHLPELEVLLHQAGMRLLGEDDAMAEVLEVHFWQADHVASYSLPGGHVVLTTGLLGAVHSKAELIGVLAHELAHLRLRHPLVNLWKNDFLSGSGVGTQKPLGDERIIESMTHYSYSDNEEMEADDLALVMLGELGLSSAGLHSFVNRFSLARPGLWSADWQAHQLHPPSIRRLENLHQFSLVSVIPDSADNHRIEGVLPGKGEIAQSCH